MPEILLASIEALHCDICFDELPDGTIISNGTDHLCVDCLSQMVMRVVDNKDPYPVKFGSPMIDVFHYAQYLNDDLLRLYKQKREEYQTFPFERVYCECGDFIGRMREKKEPGVIAAVGSCKSAGCEGWKCLFCATTLEEADLVREHGCQGKCELATHDKLELLSSEERGKKYQLCPHCQRLIERTEACNHISCHCGSEFCYVCGKEAGAFSNHWSQGGCPRWPREERSQPDDIQWDVLGAMARVRLLDDEAEQHIMEDAAPAETARASAVRNGPDAVEEWQARRVERIFNQGRALYFQPYPLPEER